MSDLLSTLQLLAGGREGCFESAATKVDAVAVCHEVRSVALSPGERVVVSFRVLNQRQPVGSSAERYLAPGEQVNLKSLQLDSVVLMSVWATDDSRIAAAKLLEPGAPPRPCGEVRIPLRHLVSKCDYALYHSWVVLDSPGLNDSFASIGLLDSAQEPGEAFQQALNNAPRQLFQPKACISLCKNDDLGPSGQVLWTADIPRKDRIARWGPLLRSQQQHVVMCTAQHLQGAQAPRDQRAQNSHQVRGLEEQAAEQARELEALKEQLRSQQAKGLAAGRRQDSEGGSSDEARRQRELGDRLEQELAGLREELAKIGDEANSKIEAANVRIRALRQERDDAVREVEQENLHLRKVQETKEDIISEKVKLSEQKEALLKIVEDLHQTCIGAGLSMTTTGRKSIDAFKFPMS
mmetsp:Transcript_100059/g.254414  ORF Transcript_100059/g.254414 Transcript_100059/m.254414 type:complete len:408 (-) Transcript_100059:18-1241(-)|eukprot:CAMPEP_0183445786 /NCGR_PEP_ID=MMETSP0370-20130417/96530_1 /TAXON_ID=268820 /ORGANISM="Peridinium aciculiferum, Strain PAER-2" /LENGTH=407 /DNA_ID=CAMNT_0025636421 /DNA_START=41 /DNA_END=1264 /DNA_ORIENTATION=-